MNAILLIAVLVLVDGGNTAYNTSPCMRNPNNNAYNQFVGKHVLREQFVTSSKDEWKNYLTSYRLCGRPRQSFIDKGAENFYVNICNSSGKRREKNLCTSTSQVKLYDLKVNTNDCTVTSLTINLRYVTVACDKVDNSCLPVHFEDSQNNKPDANGETCKP